MERQLSTKSRIRGDLVLALLAGALGGGVIVAIATRAIPKMMSGMMRGMMAGMQASGCDPMEK